jgi:Domain of unknown function (DUF3127)
MEFTQEKCELLGNDQTPAYAVGERVKVSFNIRGSEWQSKFYVNLQAWRIEKNTGDSNQPANAQPQQNAVIMQTPPAFQSNNTVTASENPTDDLPF